MARLKRFLLGLVRIFLFVLILFVIVIAWSFWKIPVKETKSFGLTYVDWVAELYGMDKRKVYLAVLDDLKVKNVRLPVYWNKVEIRDDVYKFEEIDWQLQEAEKRGVKIILNVGRKLPRWPECHQPQWALDKKDENYEKKKLLEFLKIVVGRYKNNPALYAWQVENEPFLPFGENCPLFGGGFLDRELSAVRKADPNHPVIVTDSGELSLWVRAARRADIFGTTLYRTVWQESIGYYTYPFPPGFFRVKRAITELFVGKRSAIVSELQAEPWGPYENYDYDLYPLAQQLEHFDVKTFREHIEYARQAGFDEFYLWGVEWWYWLKLQGHPEIWNEAKKLF